MARVILSEASVRISADTRQGERDAERAGEQAGRDYAKGAQRQSNRNPIVPRLAPIDAAFEASLRRQIRDIAARVTADIPLNARGEAFRQQIATRIAEVERTMRADIPTDPKLAADFRRNLQRSLDSELRRVRTRVNVGVDVDRNRITQSLSSLAGLFGRAGERITSVASTAFAPVNKILGSFNLSLSGVAIAAAAVATAAPVLAAGVTLIGGAAISAAGAITAGFAGLPVVLTSLIAPIAAVTLGMDGIKRAAEPLKDEFKSLKDSVNIAFELGMRPVFEKLQALFPTLNVGLAEVARGVTRLASDFAGILTTPAGIENVRVALGGVSTTIDRLRPGLASLFRELLAVAGTRELYEILGDTIGGLAQRFADLIYNLRASGVLEVALEGLRDVLFSVTDLLFTLAEGATHFFASAAPGLSDFFDSLTRTLGRVDWISLGESFGSMMSRLGAAIERIPPETWQRLASAVGALAEKFISWAESGGLERLISHLATAASVLSVLSTALGGIYGVVSGAMNRLFSLGDTASGVASKIGSAFSGVGDSVSTGLDGITVATDDKLPLIGESIDLHFSELPERIGGFFGQAGERVSQSWQSISDSTGEALTGFGERLDEFFSNLPDRIGYWTGYTAATVILHAQDAVAGIGGWFAQLPGLIESFVSDMFQRVVRFFSELPVKAGEFALLTVATAVNIFKDLPGRIEAFARDMVDRVVRFFSELPSRAAAFAVQTIETFINIFRDFPRRVSEWAQKTVDDIIKWFKELPGKLLQAGKDAIQGFIDGLQAKAQSLVDKAKAVVNGALRGARDAIAAHSPSLKFRDLGRDTIQGYIIGLQDKLAPLIARVKAIFAQAVAAANQAGTASLGDAINAGLGLLSNSPAFVNVTQQAVGSARSNVDSQTIAAALSATQWTARFDGPNVVQIVNNENRQLARR